MAFTPSRPRAEVWVPDGADVDDALGRTTDLGIVAHQDDLEFMALAPIAACHHDPERWFTGRVASSRATSSATRIPCSSPRMAALGWSSWTMAL